MHPVAMAFILAAAAGISGAAHANPALDLAGREPPPRGPAVTVVEQARIVGSFENNALAITFSGRATPRLPSVDVLNFDGAEIFGCEGDAFVSRRDRTTFLLTPTSTRFSTRCRLVLSEGSGFRFRQLDGVLHVESEVSDGELFVSSSGSWELVPSESPQDVAPVVTTGRHRLMFDHDESRFRYEITARNPNRSRQPVTIRLDGGERVVDVETVAQWELDQGTYRFQLPPGSTSIVFNGTLRGDAWSPPLDGDRQYVLAESHPLLLPEFETEAVRVSPEETGFGGASRGAQAFRFDAEHALSWTLSPLETLQTTAFAVNSARHVFLVADDGNVIGETSYAIYNQGASALSLPMDARPFYAGINGEPTFLTPDDDGDLRVPIAQGSQQVEVQHQQEVMLLPGFAAGTFSSPQIGALASMSSVQIRRTPHWVPLYQGAVGQAQFNYGVLPLALLLAFWAERCLAALGIARRRFLLAGVLGLAGASHQSALLVVVLALAGISFVRLLPWLRRISIVRLGIAAVALVVGLFLVVSFFQYNQLAHHLFGASTAALAGDTAVSASSARRSLKDFASSTHPGGSEFMESSPSYQGLPAKMNLPWGNNPASFGKAMIPSNEPIQARVLLVSRTVIDALILAVLLFALFLVWQQRRELVDGWTRLLRDVGIGKDECEQAKSDSPSPA